MGLLVRVNSSEIVGEISGNHLWKDRQQLRVSLSLLRLQIIFHKLVQNNEQMAPLQLVNYRSSSVTRTTTDTSEMPSRFTRAATVGPTDFKYNYVTAMPFTYQYESAVQRMLDRNLRATSVVPSAISSSTYADAYT